LICAITFSKSQFIHYLLSINKMRLKLSTLILVLIFFSIQCFAQTDIETLVNEGIQYHDNGDYIKAIEIYKKALELNPKSTLVNYEISFSYLKKGDFSEAIKYADVVLEQDDDYKLQAYITKGSALDMIGKTNESIILFKEAILKTEGHFLLYYNLDLDYFKINELDLAEGNIIKAIEMNPNHSSSHLMLANINNQKGNSDC